MSKRTCFYTEPCFLQGNLFSPSQRILSKGTYSFLARLLFDMLSIWTSAPSYDKDVGSFADTYGSFADTHISTPSVDIYVNTSLCNIIRVRPGYGLFCAYIRLFCRHRYMTTSFADTHVNTYLYSITCEEKRCGLICIYTHE